MIKDHVVNVSSSRTHDQRLLIKRTFEEIEHHDFMKALKSDLGGHLEHSALDLYMEKGEFDAYLIHEAVDGMVGFNNELLCEVLFTRTNLQLKEMQDAWLQCLKKKNMICVLVLRRKQKSY